MEDVLGWAGPIGLGVFFGGLGVFWWGLRHLAQIGGARWGSWKEKDDSHRAM